MQPTSYNFLDPQTAAANRQGEVTPAQNKALMMALTSDIVMVALAMVVGLIVLPIVAYAMVEAEAAPAWLVYISFGLAAAAYVISLVWRLGGLGLVREELKTQAIDQAEGEYLWRGRRYLAWAAGRKLHSPGRLNLPPGPYRFFFLRRSGWLLSAEKLETAGVAEADMQLLRALARANRFNLHTLAANRAGQLGRGQALAILWARYWLPLALLVAGLWLGFGLILLARQATESGVGVIFVYALAAAAAAAVYIARTAPNVAALARDLRLGQVKAAEGPVRKARAAQTFGAGQLFSVNYYYYRLGAQQFPVSAAAYNALVDGRQYRLYYLPRSLALVGIEPVG